MSARALVPSAALILLGLLSGLAWWLALDHGDGPDAGEAGEAGGPALVLAEAPDDGERAGDRAGQGTAERLATPERPGTAGSASLAGRVLDGDGEPLAGVEVSLTPAKVTTRALWRAPTDAEGRFAFEGLPAGNTGLSALPDGAGVPTFSWVSLAPGERRDDLVLTLRRPAELLLSVRGARGDPLPGQLLRIKLWGGGLDPRAGALRQGFESDADGQVVVRGLPAGTYEVSHPRWDLRQRITLGNDEQASMTLTHPMRRGLVGRLEGRGGLTADLHVRARPLEVEGQAEAQWTDLIGPDHFELALPAAGLWQVWAEGPVGGGSRPVVVEVPDQGLVDLVLTLEQGGLAGRLTWDHDGSPAVGVRVGVAPLEGDDGDREPPAVPGSVSPFASTVLTDGEGRYRLSHLHAGRYSVQLGARVHGAGDSPSLPEPLVVELLDGERRTDLDAVVCPGTSLSVTVAGPDGLPIQRDLTLRLTLEPVGGKPVRRWARLNRTQHFDDLQPGDYRLVLTDGNVTWRDNGLRELVLSLGQHERRERRLVLTRDELLAAQQAALASEVDALPARPLERVEDG